MEYQFPFVYTHTYTHAHMHTDTSTFMNRKYIDTHIFTYINTDTHIDIYNLIIYTHTWRMGGEFKKRNI